VCGTSLSSGRKTHKKESSNGTSCSKNSQSIDSLQKWKWKFKIKNFSLSSNSSKLERKLSNNKTEKARIWLNLFFIIDIGELIKCFNNDVAVARFGEAPATKSLVCKLGEFTFKFPVVGEILLKFAYHLASGVGSGDPEGIMPRPMSL